MVQSDELTNFITQTLGSDLLAKAAQIDTAPNGVQIKGADDVSGVALGVSCSQAFIDQAIKQKANYLICHHGLNPDHVVKNGRFDFIQSRLELLFRHHLTLAGYHYALDAHPTLGNNAVIISKLGAKRLPEPYFGSWGWVGEFIKPQPIKIIVQRAAKIFQHEVYRVLSGPKLVKRLGVCSGGARPHLHELFEIIDNRIDLHLTGEISESSPHQAEAGHFHYLACGHYATEVFGVQALAQKIKTHFGRRLTVAFIDIPSTL
ncbi:hypothetical protein A2W24_06055 [Microgenomates group bacterium RBG_16_45_19]|nr:MAG: hypothetical protein A2W24_06055 [Microgenomates group bacterium RBG_16_45_19]